MQTDCYFGNRAINGFTLNSQPSLGRLCELSTITLLRSRTVNEQLWNFHTARTQIQRRQMFCIVFGNDTPPELASLANVY